MKNSKRSAKKVTPAERETLEAFLGRAGVGDAWDIVIFGDGSGSNWGREAAWASVSVERQTLMREVWCGFVNRGTVNFAEGMAYLQPLNWFAAREEERRSQHGGRRTAYRVHIFTDSEYCRLTGSRPDRTAPVKNAVLWAALDVLSRQGFILNWHWIKGGSCELNGYADVLSKLTRRAGKEHDFPQRMEQLTEPTRTVYDYNPSAEYGG
jgi:ribonuclease HI